jgi:RHS repeat-associated protein
LKPAGSGGATTNLLYVNDSSGVARLARIVRPGGDTTDYGYDTAGTGLVTRVRDSLANDAVAAGVRQGDDGTTTSISYDVLGRARSVALPAPQPGADRSIHSYEFGDHTTQTHLSGEPEPHGFGRQVTYDETYRTLTETDVAGLVTRSVWDTDANGKPRKDLLLSTTDPAGLMSTTIYDYADRPTDQYGRAPAGRFGSDRMPASGHSGDIPHNRTGYDEGMRGLAASYYDYNSNSKTLVGVPKAHDTALGDSGGNINHSWGGTPPASFDSGDGNTGWGVRLTGDIKLHDAGIYHFRVRSDDGARMYVDNELVVDDWLDGDIRDHPERRDVTINNDKPDSYHPIRIDYYNKSSSDRDATLALYMTPPGGTETGDLGGLLLPRYGLDTSATTYDSNPDVDNQTTTTDYGTHPELGLAQKTTEDPGGLNYTTTDAYEPQGAPGSFLRETSKKLPGGAQTQFSYYGADENRTNPCDSSQTANQAGMTKFRREPDLAGHGQARATESVYDAKGEVVATRVNDDGWTCISYDARGRIVRTVIPSNATGPGRTLSNDWAVGSNPLATSTGDSHGTVTTTSDLLGRAVSYRDTRGDVTHTSYDAIGRIADRIGPLGHEQFAYDDNGWLSEQRLDGRLLGRATYDTAGRLKRADYPQAQEALDVSRDDLGRPDGMDYTLADGSTHVRDHVVRSQSGDVVTSVENGLEKHYSYDKGGRLTFATFGGTSYKYEFGGVNDSCGPGANAAAGADGNRTRMTVVSGDDTTTTQYCYDDADRLLSSTDPAEGTPDYDSHGNVVQLGGGSQAGGGTAAVTRFGYDASDRNVRVSQGDEQITYTRDATNRITRRDEIADGVRSSASFGFTGTGDDPDLVYGASGSLRARYVELLGGTLLTLNNDNANKPWSRVNVPNPGADGGTTMSLVNVHGDVMGVTDEHGKLTATFRYDPFGNPLGGHPVNSVDGTSYGWVGEHEKLSEAELVLHPTEMGGRVYLPTLGRFTSVDPVPGGTDNNYAYPLDPVNAFDLTGEFSTLNLWAGIAQHSGDIGAGLAVGGLAVCVVATAGTCAVATAGLAAVGGGITASADLYNGPRVTGRRVARAIGHGLLQAIPDALGARKVKAVRWFGNGRNYRKLTTALRKAPGRARLRRLVRDKARGYVRGRIIDHFWK